MRYGCLAEIYPCGINTVWIMLYREERVELARLDFCLQCHVTCCTGLPYLLLMLEHFVYTGELVLYLSTHHFFSYLEFYGAQTVFVCIMLVLLFHAKNGIGISFPTAAEIQLVVYACNMMITADGQSHSIVFAVTCIRETYLTEYCRVKGSGSTQPIDAQCIVAAILLCPFPVGY